MWKFRVQIPFLLYVKVGFPLCRLAGFPVQTRPGGGGKPVQITGARQSGRGLAAPPMLHNVLSLSSLPLSVDCTNQPLSFQAQVTLQLTDGHSDVVSVFSACPPMLGRSKKFFTVARTGSRRPCLFSLRCLRQF